MECLHHKKEVEMNRGVGAVCQIIISLIAEMTLHKFSLTCTISNQPCEKFRWSENMFYLLTFVPPLSFSLFWVVIAFRMHEIENYPS